MPEPKQVPHPLYSTQGRKHYDPKLSNTYDWKPCLKVIPEKDLPRPERPYGTKKIEMEFTDMRPRAEMRHLQANPSDTYEDLEIGKKTFIDIHNRKSVNEYCQETVMGTKKRIPTLYDQRNGLPINSLGDKIYKLPDYQPGFFKEGGLIVGSTHQKKIRSYGNPKAIDFYAGIELDKGPLNPNRKLWKDAVREEQLNEELGAVSGLKDWEKNVLKEVDPKYQVNDSSDEEDNKK